MGRHRSLVLVSVPSACALCDGERVVRLVSLGALRGGGPVACPHCSSAPGHTPIPIYLYPLRADRPRQTGGVA